MAKENNGFSKESSELIRKLRELDFVNETHTESVNLLNSHNYENTLIYNKKTEKYIASVRVGGRKYTIPIKVKGNKPNPKYEKQIKKLV